MKVLLIIGNGFDLSHGLHTCYNDFKEYLYETDSVLYDLLKNKMSDFLWSNFEEDLGYLDFSDEISYYYREIEDGFDSYSAVNNMVVTLYDCRKIMESMNYFVKKWIKTIDTSKAIKRKRFFDLIKNNECYFLSFNYTDTLEKKYNIRRVCHIHGNLKGKLILGHGEKYIHTKECNIKDYTDNYATFSELIEMQNNIDFIHNILKKDVYSLLKKNRKFFEQLKDVEQVYSYGFSYGKVDLPYIKEIINNISNNKNSKWFFYDYNIDENKKYKNLVKSCGFNGQYDSFHC